METPPPLPHSDVKNLSEWDAREYEELLARETGEWREKRLVAEDPNTTADMLSRLVDDVDAVIGFSDTILTQENKKFTCCSMSLPRIPISAPKRCRKCLGL